MPTNIIKLVVGIETLKDFYDFQQHEIFDYHGQPAFPCWTRNLPKQADEILKVEGAIYRVIKGRIQCRFKILGFEKVETNMGTKCMIVQSADMIQTIAQPHRPFQGWRYLKDADIPKDRGLYQGHDLDEEPPEDMAEDLKELGLL